MDSKLIVTLFVIAALVIAVIVGIFVADSGEGEQLPPGNPPQEEEISGEDEADPNGDQEGQEENGEEEDEEDEPPKLTKEELGWNLLLANGDNPLPEDFSPQVETVQNGYQMDSRVAPIMKEMIEDAKADGVDLLVCSAYRSIEKQTQLFNNQVDLFMSQGMTREKAEAETATMIAVPGTSEHHTGLAADIVTPTHQTLDPQFADTKAGQWLLEHAVEYGFVLRYPEEKQDITNIIYESWHYRYVGKEHAEIMKEKNLCLEEYLETLLAE